MNICSIYLATLSGTPPIAIAARVILLENKPASYFTHRQYLRRKSADMMEQHMIFSEQIPLRCNK